MVQKIGGLTWQQTEKGGNQLYESLHKIAGQMAIPFISWDHQTC